VRWSGGRLLYVGAISRGPFEQWAQSVEGQAAVNRACGRVKFALFGKARVARRRLWAALTEAVGEERFGLGIQREIDAYFERIGEAAYAVGLPGTVIELRRLVAVPRIIINTAAHKSMSARLGSELRFMALEEGDDLREFFYLELIRQIEVAIAKAQPSAKRPLAAGETWVSVGLNGEFVWQVPFRGPGWPGHHYVLELTRQPVTRGTRKAVAAAVPTLDSSISSLPRLERIEIVRRAGKAA
jgi:hypothetical protein